MSSIFSPYSHLCNPQKSSILLPIDTPQQLSMPPKSFTTKEIKIEINKLPNHKFPGYDLITSEIVQYFPRKAVLFLTAFYTSVLLTIYFPNQWKVSITIMILKPNKTILFTFFMQIYQPALDFCQLLKKLLYHRILLVLQRTIPNHQFGFLHHHSTIPQLH